MSDTIRREAVRQFINKWNNKGNAEQDCQLFWIDFLTDVVGIDDATSRVSLW